MFAFVLLLIIMLKTFLMP